MNIFLLRRYSLKDIKTRDRDRERIKGIKMRGGNMILSAGNSGNGDESKGEDERNYAVTESTRMVGKGISGIRKAAGAGTRFLTRKMNKKKHDKERSERKPGRNERKIKDKILIVDEKSINESQNRVGRRTLLLTGKIVKDVGKHIVRTGKALMLTAGPAGILFMVILMGTFSYLFSGYGYSRNGEKLYAYYPEIRKVLDEQIETIKENGVYDRLEYSEDTYSFGEILALHSIISRKQKAEAELVLLKEIYVSSFRIEQGLEEVEKVTVIEHVDHEGNMSQIEEKSMERVLTIKVSKVDIVDLFSIWSFSEGDRQLYQAYLEDDIQGFMNVYGGTENSLIVEIARREVGYTGGEKYWRAYGFNRHAAWCACFVTWCADEAGLIKEGKVPRFALCANGVKWFRDKGKWMDRNGIPEPGMIIFYDRRTGNGYGQDGRSDHTGIVEKIEGNYVYTIEGNWGDKVDTRKVRLDDRTILGYGLIA